MASERAGMGAHGACQAAMTSDRIQSIPGAKIVVAVPSSPLDALRRVVGHEYSILSPKAEPPPCEAGGVRWSQTSSPARAAGHLAPAAGTGHCLCAGREAELYPQPCGQSHAEHRGKKDPAAKQSTPL